jgi:hypothetical protein
MYAEAMQIPAGFTVVAKEATIGEVVEELMLADES